jgi:hypothetical protein
MADTSLGPTVWGEPELPEPLCGVKPGVAGDDACGVVALVQTECPTPMPAPKAMMAAPVTSAALRNPCLRGGEDAATGMLQ